MAGKLDLRPVLPLPYDRPGFIRDVLRPVFGPGRLTVFSADQSTGAMTAADQRLAISAVQYGELQLDDDTEVRCLEVRLQPKVRPEQNRVGIQALVRRLLTTGQAALVNFVPATAEVGFRPWRFTLVAKDAVLRDGKVVEQTNNARRYTYLLGPGQACRTPADRLRQLATEADVTLDTLVKAFEVEVLSKEFFKEYKRHYLLFCEELTGSNFKKSVFNGDEKAIRDFVKKLLGRLVFLYFVQKKGWLGAGSTAYTDGDQNFITKLFHASGANATFYPVWLSRLFFETLNEERPGDLFTMPDGEKVCIPFLNGGLFDRDAHDAAKYQLTLPAGLFHQARHANDPAGRGFLDFLDSYNFTVQEDSPDEHVVAVDPEMLGNIFENLLEDNKDKGAFYTPKEIVHYMCRESLIEYLDTRLNLFEVALGSPGKGLAAGAVPAAKAGQLALTTTENRGNVQRAELEKFVREKVANDFIRQHARQIDELLDTVKICDPAIGSGAFPMGLLHEIYLCKLVLKDLTQVQHGSLFHERDHLADPSSYHAGVKLGIIQNSIYGVDIERGAVDIARLRFWLSLVVDEDRPRPLPNLDYKIVVGNSLVSKLGNDTLALNWNLKAGTEREAKLRQQYKSLGTLQRQFFTKSGAKKVAVQAQIRDAKIDLLVAQVELEIAKLPTAQATMFGGTAKQQAADLATLAVRQGYDAQLRQLWALRADASRALPYFDWRLDFPEVLNPHVTEQPGFDIVIGNPPYISLSRLKDEVAGFAAGKYETYEKGGDIYCLFYESGIRNLRSNGVLSFITSNSWMQTDYGRSLRRYFTSNTNPLTLINLVDVQIFDTAIVEANIIIIRRSDYKSALRATSVGADYKLGVPLTEYVKEHQVIISTLAESGWSVSNVWGNELKTKFDNAGRPLKNWPVKIYRGITTGFNDAFLINNRADYERLLKADPKNKEIIKPILRGRDLRPYSYKFAEQWIIFSRRGIDIKKYPTIENHLRNYYPQLKPKHNGEKVGRKPGPYNWFEIQDNTTYHTEFQKPKIIWGKLCDFAKFTYDTSGHYLLNTVLFMIGEDLQYLLAVMGSKPCQWYFDQIATTNGMGTNEWINNRVEKLSVPMPTSAVKSKAENLVTKILAAKATSATADTTALEAEIDVLVYHLYGLKYEEVLLVEPEFGMSKTAYVAAGKVAAVANNSAGA